MSNVNLKLIQNMGGLISYTIEHSSLDKETAKRLHSVTSDFIELNIEFSRLNINELKTLELSAHGHKTVEISQMLYKSIRCINLYKTNIQEKLSVKSYETALIKFTEYRNYLNEIKNIHTNLSTCG